MKLAYYKTAIGFNDPFGQEDFTSEGEVQEPGETFTFKVADNVFKFVVVAVRRDIYMPFDGMQTAQSRLKILIAPEK